MPAPKSLGFVIVASAGTPQALAPSQTLARSVRIQPRSAPGVANVGNIYLGSQGMNKATGAGVYAVLSPEQTEGIQIGPLVDLALMFIDADNSGDGCLTGYMPI